MPHEAWGQVPNAQTSTCAVRWQPLPSKHNKGLLHLWCCSKMSRPRDFASGITLSSPWGHVHAAPRSHPSSLSSLPLQKNQIQQLSGSESVFALCMGIACWGEHYTQFDPSPRAQRQCAPPPLSWRRTRDRSNPRRRRGRQRTQGMCCLQMMVQPPPKRPVHPMRRPTSTWQASGGGSAALSCWKTTS